MTSSAWMMTEAYLVQRTARRSLVVVSPTADLDSVHVAGATGSRRTARGLRGGEAIALLSIPRLGMSAVVLHGSDEATLRRGPGHVENSALPGTAGNVVIAGHRDTFFRPLRHVRIGDTVVIDTVQETVRYRITSLDVVKPHDLSVIEPTSDPTLTLITCFPFWVLGDAPDRFIVRAAKVADARFR